MQCNIKGAQSPGQRVMSVLRGEIPDKIPFTVYECMISPCKIERELRNRGLCIIQRIPSYHIIRPNITEKANIYTDEKGRKLIRTVYTSPAGELSTLTENGVNTIWTHEHIFKSPDDYKALEFYINDSKIVPDYGRVSKTALMLDDDFAVRDQIPLEPLQALISEYMGTETFSYEWMDNRDEIIRLYSALRELNRKVYPVVAEGPLEFANYGGNVVPQIIGKETFRKYYMPNYEEAAEVLHRKGKLIGCHFDADNTPIMEDIAETQLDYIEAYDPGISPPVDVAMKMWPNKVLWINWPSSWHLHSLKEVYEDTIKLIQDAGSKGHFLIGITEDVPEDLWQGNYSAIMDAIEHK